MGTGFMKCVDITLELALISVGSELVAAAILVILILLVFVARIAWLGQICASSLKILVLRSGISGTASMTKSTSEREEMDVLDERRARVASKSCWVMRDLERSLASSLSANFRPLSMLDWELSIIKTGMEAWRAATRAMPRPYQTHISITSSSSFNGCDRGCYCVPFVLLQ